LVERLERTGRQFDLSASQEEYLRVRSISQDVIERMRTLNRGPAAPSPRPRPDVASLPMPAGYHSKADAPTPPR
jgi:hypothetical protein